MSDEQTGTEQPAPQQPGTGHRETEERRRERDEKEEKDEGRGHEEKEEKEPGWGRDPLGGIIWALILISVGVILLAQSLGYVEWDQFGGIWNLIFIAVGLIVLLEVAIRLVVPAYRRPVLGSLIFGVIMLSIGLGGFVGWGSIWPVALIIIGVVMVVGTLLRGRF